MIRKIVHLSDIHLRLYKRHEEYKEQFIKFFNDCEKIKPDRLVITGDIVHSKNSMSPELIDMLSWLFNRCTDIAKTIVLIGNHDLIKSNKDRMDALSPITKLIKNDNDLIYYKRKGCHLDDNVVWCVYSCIDNNERPNIEKAKEKYGEDKEYIGLYHGQIKGMKTDLGFKFTDGDKIGKFDGLSYTLCGDIHRRSVFYNNQDRPIIMVGSFIQQNYGENVNDHGFCLVDLEDNDYCFYDLNSDYGYYKFEINSIDDLEEGNEKLMNYED